LSGVLFLKLLVVFLGMKIFKRITRGKLKGWTIRVSKFGWYDLYSSGGISQFSKKNSLEEIQEVIKNLS
jgi:hypothetical protein